MKSKTLTVSLVLAGIIAACCCGAALVTRSNESVSDPTPTTEFTPTPVTSITTSNTPIPVPKAYPNLQGTLVSNKPRVTTVRAGAYCSPAGATGQTSGGVGLTCKSADTDTRNRWRK